jgi:hypothetical protein
MGTGTSRLTSGIFMAVLGAGMGFLMQITMLVAQNSVELKDMGVASSTATLFRTIGGSFGVALFGAIYTNRMTDTLSKAGMKGGGGNTADLTPARLRGMDPKVQDVIHHGVTNGIHSVFLWAAAISVLAIAASLFLRGTPLRGTGKPADSSAAMAH